MSLKYLNNILLVEDNPGDQDLIQILLDESGLKYDLWIGNTFAEGVKHATESEIDIVLLDLSLSDSSGFSTLVKFKKEAPPVPIIVLTGTNNEIVGNQSIKAGAQDFLVKGQFDGKLLGRVIRYALQRFGIQRKLEVTAARLEESQRRFQDAQQISDIANWEMELVGYSMFWSEQFYEIIEFRKDTITPSLSEYLKLVYPEDRNQVEDFFTDLTSSSKVLESKHRLLLDGKRKKQVKVRGQLKSHPKSGELFLTGTIQLASEQEGTGTKQKAIFKGLNSETMVDYSFQTRTPLASALNLVYLLEQEPLKPAQAELVHLLKDSMDDLTVSVNNLLNYSVLLSNRVSIEQEEFVLSVVLQSLWKSLDGKFSEKGINGVLDIQENSTARFKADVKKIFMVCYNIMEFAIENASPKMDFSLSANIAPYQQPKSLLQLGLSWKQGKIANRKLLELLTSDESEEAMLNSRSEQEKRLKMGVFISGKLISALGGKWSVETKRNLTELTLEFPVQNVFRLNVNPAEGPQVPLSILMMEDHMLNQIATKKVLKSWSPFVSVEIAANGRIGLEMFEKNQYDIILMDIQMPEMDGLEATRAIRKVSDIPIIALTAQNNNSEEQQVCKDAGMNDYLAKPFKPEDLFTAIAKLISLPEVVN